MKKSMKVFEIEVEKLLPYWQNPRKNEKTVNKLVTSIKQFGFNVPIVVNNDMVLITGHARLKAAKRLGMETVPCVIVDMTDEQAKKYRIADNKIQESSKWDDEALFKELREIGNPLDLVDIGFSSKEIEDIVGDISSLIDEAEKTAEQTIQSLMENEPESTSNIPTMTAQPRKVEVGIYKPSENEESNFEQSKPQMINIQVSEEEMMKKIREREEQINNRFKKESREMNQSNNLVICPHCGTEFMIKA